MNLPLLKSWGTICLLSVVCILSHSQEKSTLTVPTPSFSNPGKKPSKTTVPVTGTALKKSQVRAELFGGSDTADGSVQSDNSQQQSNQNNSAQPNLDPEDELSSGISKTDKAKIISSSQSVVNPRAPQRQTGRSAFSNTEKNRAEMLEKIGDQLSLRMRSMREREKALSQREEALLEREKRAQQRETLLRDVEESLLRREEVVRRREKLPPPQAWRGKSPPSIHGQYAAVLDGETMQFYYTKKAMEKTPVASTQKLLTALIIIEEGGLNEYITITKEATTVEPTKIGIKTGERYTRLQLLTSLLVRSGNDIAAALAIDNAGSSEAFALKMNSWGKRIGLINSNFKTPHGLPATGQYSCARDIAIVAFEAYQNPVIREIVRKKTFNFNFNDDRVYRLTNTNRLLHNWPECNGMKTGFTFKAGKCLVASSEVDGKHRISVIIKSTSSYVYNDSKKLLQWANDLEMLGPLE